MHFQCAALPIQSVKDHWIPRKAQYKKVCLLLLIIGFHKIFPCWKVVSPCKEKKMWLCCFCILNLVEDTMIISLLTHQVHKGRRVVPIGLNSGCGRGKEMRRRGFQHYSQSLLWQIETGGAVEWRQDGHPTEHPIEDRFMLKSTQMAGLSFLQIRLQSFLSNFPLLLCQ